MEKSFVLFTKEVMVMVMKITTEMIMRKVTARKLELVTFPGLFIAKTWQGNSLKYLLVEGEDEEDAGRLLKEYLAEQEGKWTSGAINEAKVVKRGS